MKWKYILLMSFVILACGPSEEEIQSQIDTAVEQALETSTTTSIPVTTSTSTSTTTIVESKSFYEEVYEEEFYFLLNSSDYLINSSNYYLRLRATWSSVKNVLLHFSDYGEVCTNSKDSNLNGNKSYIAILINSDIENCFNSKELIAIEIRGENVKNTVVFYNNSTYSNYFDSNVINKQIEFTCCHQIEFEELNNFFTELKNIYKNPPTTTTTLAPTTTTSTLAPTTTTSTLAPTTTTSTTTTTLFTDNEVPTWPNKEVTITNINPTYFEVLWNTASDNINVAGYKFYLNNQLKGEFVRNNDNNSIFLDGLTSGTTYNLEIVAYDDAGNTSTNNPRTTVVTSGTSSNTSNQTTTTTTLACLEDNEPPALVNYSYSPNSVDVSSAPGQVEVLLTVTDNCSGVGTGFYGIDVTTSPSTGFSTASLISGTNTNGVWKAVINIPQNHFQSTFSITLYPLGDNRQNTGGFTQLGTFEVINNP
jgi:hypothetical protein